MPVVLSGITCRDAWIAGANYLAGQPRTEISSLLLTIEDPTSWDDAWFDRIDPRQVHSGGENPRNVANTIFPLKTWLNASSRTDLYQRYRRAHKRGRTKRWGTYFLRLICFGASEINQLERAINVLNSWHNQPGTAIVFHLSSPETDTPRPIGGPCLQLIQLQAWSDRLDLIAVYRNHDYFNKAFPNLIGLSRLLHFICHETSRKAGTITCHSGHAYSSAGKSALKDLVARA